MAYFIDKTLNIWVLDYDLEDFAPAKYDQINHAFIHKELNKTTAVVFKEYADHYFTQFVSQFTNDEKEKKLVKSVCYDSIENPFLIFDHIITWYNGYNKKETLILLKYLENVILSNQKRNKNLEKLLEQTKKITKELDN